MPFPVRRPVYDGISPKHLETPFRVPGSTAASLCNLHVSYPGVQTRLRTGSYMCGSQATFASVTNGAPSPGPGLTVPHVLAK